MLDLFRRYQRILYIMITIVIVISFSFFGTYSTLTPDDPRDQVAFHTVDGTSIKRSDVEEMVIFLSTDADDKLMYGGAWGPNFLNDGVVKKDFLQTGLAEVLLKQYNDLIESELQTKLEKEKRYAFYQHPQAKFINVEAAWAMFAPDVKENIHEIKNANRGTDPDALNARIQLFLAERRFPSSTLRQVLKYQERQYNWVSPDPAIDQSDFSIFGYHTLEDWFGSRFMRIIAQFIINSAKIAEKRGYEVTKTEALTDLLQSAVFSYQQQASNPNLGVRNASEYFNEQLRRLGLDQNKAIKLWSQVLLFRRLFHDMGDSVFADAMVSEAFSGYANEAVEVDLYHLPQDVQIANFRTLQKFETYLNAISKRTEDSLALPTTFLTIDEIEKKNPELVQKRYYLEVAEVDKKNLQSRIGLKETWNWEVEDKNWETLKKQFPEIALKKGDTKQERYVILDGLDDTTRSRLDTFARNAIIDSHPDWIDDALQNANYKKMALGIRTKGGQFPFKGVSNRSDFIKLLDSSDKSLNKYSGDNQVYYRIVVLDRSGDKEIMTFAEAGQDSTLDDLLNRQLETNYIKIRQSKPELFQQEDKTWKEFNQVKDVVADQYFENLLNQLRNLPPATEMKKSARNLTGDMVAPLRFYTYLQDLKTKATKDPKGIQKFLKDNREDTAEGKLSKKQSLDSQWKLIKETQRIDRSASAAKGIESNEAFALPQNGWSKVNTGLMGDLYFLQVKEKGLKGSSEKIAKEVENTHKLLSSHAQIALMEELLAEIQQKKAISLDYMKTREYRGDN